MIEKRLTKNDHGEPVLTVRVTGAYDTFRFARVMQTGQMEFARKGTLALQSLRRFMGTSNFRQLERFCLGDGKVPQFSAPSTNEEGEG